MQPEVGTILKFGDKVFKVVEVTTTKVMRWEKNPPYHASFKEVDVPAVAVLESHPSYAGWSEEVRYMHMSYWKSMCTRGATELPADWQPPAESASQRRNREKLELLAEIEPLLTPAQFGRLKELL